MFDDIYRTQTIADALKAVLPRSTPAQREENKPLYEEIQVFERSEWNAAIFREVFEMATKWGLTTEHAAEGFWKFAVAPGHKPGIAVALLLTNYKLLMARREYTIPEAAAALGVAEATIKHHVYNTGKLPCRLEHSRVIISQYALDDFRANPPKPGNPTSRPRNTGKKRKDTETVLE